MSSLVLIMLHILSVIAYFMIFTPAYGGYLPGPEIL
jgi:hypothetical protein